VIAESVHQGFGLSEDGVISGTERLDDLEVPSGSVLERDFTVARLPGFLALDLRINGQPAPFVELRLLGPIDVDGRTNAAGHFGPKRVPGGTWSVWAYDRKAGWDGPLSGDILVDPGEQADAVFDAQLVPGTLTCVGADGRALAGEPVTVVRVGQVGPWDFVPTSPVASLKTDANGRLSLQLMPGEYALQRGVYEPWNDEEGSTSPFTWTSSGPLVERVQL